MPRSRGIKRRLFTVSGVFALAAASLTAASLTAAAAVSGGSSRPQPAPAAAPAADLTYTSQYSCDLSKFGYTGAPVTISGTLSLPAATASGPVTTPASTGLSALYDDAGLHVSFTTSTATLPASVAAQLTNVESVNLSAALPVRGAAVPSATMLGWEIYVIVPGEHLTQLRGNGDGTVFASQPGTAWLEFPARPLVFTIYQDNGHGPKPLPPITCTPARTSIAPVKIIVTGPASKAPVYTCGAVRARVSSYRTPLPMTVTATGSRSAGHTVTVTLKSPPAGLGAPAPYAAVKVKFAGALPVMGAQHGQVALNATTTKNLASPSAAFTVSGRLRLTKRGTDRIFFPRRFVYTVYMNSGAAAVYTCTLTAGAARVPLTLKVAR
jgi:hypothetical protein